MKIIPLTAWFSLSRQELLDLLPLTNNSRDDKRDPTCWRYQQGIPVGSTFRGWIYDTLAAYPVTDHYSLIPDNLKIVRIVNDDDMICAWGAIWPARKNYKHVALYVRYDLRRKGLGSLILNQLRIENEKPIDDKLLLCHPWNFQGRRFFNKMLLK